MPEHHFPIDLACLYAEALLHHDEVERALWVLANLPAVYRDHIPAQVTKLRQEILASMCTPHTYLTCPKDTDVETPARSAELLRQFLRGVLVEAQVKDWNKAGYTPHLIELAPGSFFIPLGLKHLGYAFTYKPITLRQDTLSTALNHITLTEVCPRQADGSSQPMLFIAHELIEHLASPFDLSIECAKHCGRQPEQVHLSTPCYTYDVSVKDWKRPMGLPHLRAYTPTEFIETAFRVFPGYDWKLHQSPVMSLCGVLRKRTGVLDGSIVT